MEKQRLNNSFDINIYKHNNEQYRVYKSCKLINDDKDNLVFDLKNVYVEQKYKKNYTVEGQVYWIFPKDKWYNIIWFVDSEKFKFYINIASPIKLVDDCFKYIDYDLDLKVLKDYSYQIIDMKDFNKNRIKLNYPPDVIASIWDAIDGIKKVIKNREFIFDGEYQDKFIKEVK